MKADYEKRMSNILKEINEVASVLPHGKRMQIFNRTSKVASIFKKAVKSHKQIEIMDRKKAPNAKRLILQALLEGARITSYDANIIGHTVAGDRRIREIRKDHPVEDVWTQDEYGRRFKVYFMNPEDCKKYKTTAIC